MTKNNPIRVYVRKKEEFDFLSRDLKKEIENALSIKLRKLVVYRCYDLDIDEETFSSILYTVLAEKPVDEVYVENESKPSNDLVLENPIRVVYLEGQFDQREESLLDTIKLFTDKKVRAKVSLVYDIGEVQSPKDREEIEKYLINPVDSRVTELYENFFKEEKDTNNLENITFDGFISYDDRQLEKFLNDKSLAMNLDDLKVFQAYFKSINRDPNETELAIIDTYWSDHCRHTTFNTELTSHFDLKTKLDEEIKKAFDEYLQMRRDLKREKPVTLMDMGTILARHLRAKGMLDDQEISDEINACSIKIKVKVEVDGKIEERPYLLMFKNETHNHPTEIEPVGGASTCLGGAIRDPLSGRSFVYQAMRISGAANPFTPVSETLKGKLPQKQITRQAAKGYSSYGNQIGLATGYVDEIYHPSYVAKRLEAGAVIAAAPEENVKRLKPQKGDMVILLGGRTGRDGIGGATGSSKSHKETSIKTQSAQVQKGNAPEERKIQRLFRIPELAKLIKKCNDFGAGGVSIAIGELSDSIEIFLDRVPLKYNGLKPKEIAISESQERMAVVIGPQDYDKFMEYAHSENLEATHVATVTDTNNMLIKYKDKIIADLSYDFINSTGAKRKQEVFVSSEDLPKILNNQDKDPKNLRKYLSDLNIASKKNLIEIFDPSVGRSTVLAPLGGNKQTVPVQTMAAKIPSFDGNVKTASLMSYGFNPYLSEESQFLGGYYAVIESICKIIASGGSPEKIRLSFQEYFEKLKDKKAWSKPLKALLGAFEASKAFDAPPIGGKDSMSGTFENIDVPPTLISFAVTTADVQNIISPDFKGRGRIGLIEISYDDVGKIDLQILKENLKKIHKDILDGNIISATAITNKGTLSHIFENALYQTGFDIKLDDLYSPKYGSFIVEFLDNRDFIREIGKFAEAMTVNGYKLDKEDLERAYIHKFDEIFSPKDSKLLENFENKKAGDRRKKSTKLVEKVKVVIPAFPGTNSEWDTKRAFEDEGAEAEIILFKNRTNEDIENSLEELSRALKDAQILAIPGGFSMGDEPDGSGKFIASVIKSPKVKCAIEFMLEENDGLILGICNGFQALIKTGLLPYGKIKNLESEDPTLTFNSCQRHIATIEKVRMMTKNSPWLTYLDEESYMLPISHGEGRFVGNKEVLDELLENEQVVGVYENCPNGSSLNIESIISKDGKIFGKMGHSERVDDGLFKNVPDMKKQNIFRAGVEYFRK
ncbi:phosphoribosylformylglycinamidine synthase [Peptoniphilus raoultii]|uniref:phosphoribosylformylglycinamidine synthase n=1 Tax=Peptoniphilus raoultii TaxID=1776387 RepID=UPI0008DA1CB8|nr:phosphoribosylformylglycinamidine synthase [Peptoniphilus raoultii]